MRFRHPAQLVVAAFAVATLVGAALLSLPLAREAGEAGGFVDAWFTATSAVCITGLTVVDTTAHWSAFGEVVILALVQVGGFGIMTLSALLILLLARRVGIRQRLVAAQETGSLDIGEVRRVILGVAGYSLFFEVLAFAVLLLRFWVGHDEGLGRAAYHAVFHAVSSFNNAGFALFPDSLVGFADDPVVLLTIAVVVIAGGLGYPVWSELRRLASSPRKWSLHVKLTILATAVLLAAGWFGVAWFEWTNPATLGEMGTGQKALNAFVQGVMPRSAGFNSVPMDALRDPTQLLVEVLMFIGGGSASTAGGIKVTTFALLGFVMWAEVRGEQDVVAFERRVPPAAQRQALSVALLSIGAIIVATMAVMATSSLPRAEVLFEVVSAFATAGLTLGITDQLPTLSEVIFIGVMVAGRVGPITVFVALVLKERERLYRFPEERPIVG